MGLLTADFELEMGDVNYDMLKNALRQFDCSIVQPNHVSSFLDMVCQDFENNLKEEEKFLVAFTMKSFDCGHCLYKKGKRALIIVWLVFNIFHVIIVWLHIVRKII